MASIRLQDSARRQDSQRRYRYRTKVLVGSWRNTRQQAVEDALKAGQARLGDGEGDTATIEWIIKGFIEEGRPFPKARTAS